MTFNNVRVMRGVALIAIALFFGVQSLGYHLGVLSRPGPGFFPLLISIAVGLIGIVMIVQARFEDAEPIEFKFKNIGFVLLSLVGFALITAYVAMLPAILFLVFVSAFAGTDYSIVRNLKVSAVLIALGFAFHYGLGVQLPLI